MLQDDDIAAANVPVNHGIAYTKMGGLMGEGEESEPKLGTHYWPGNNNALLLAVRDEKIKPLCDLVRKLKVEHPRAGLRAFTFPLEEECV